MRAATWRRLGRINRIIVQSIFNHLVPVRPEHGDFGRNAPILATGLLVKVVRRLESSFVTTIRPQWVYIQRL